MQFIKYHAYFSSINQYSNFYRIHDSFNTIFDIREDLPIPSLKLEKNCSTWTRQSMINYKKLECEDMNMKKYSNVAGYKFNNY